MAKSPYRSNRNRRIPQPGGIGGQLVGMFQLRVFAWDSITREVIIRAVLPDAEGNPTPGFAPWRFPKVIGQDTHQILIIAVKVPSEITVVGFDLLQITYEEPGDDIEIWIKAGTVDLDSVTGLTCSGLLTSSDDL